MKSWLTSQIKSGSHCGSWKYFNGSLRSLSLFLFSFSPLSVPPFIRFLFSLLLLSLLCPSFYVYLAFCSLISFSKFLVLYIFSNINIFVSADWLIYPSYLSNIFRMLMSAKYFQSFSRRLCFCIWRLLIRWLFSLVIFFFSFFFLYFLLLFSFSSSSSSSSIFTSFTTSSTTSTSHSPHFHLRLHLHFHFHLHLRLRLPHFCLRLPHCFPHLLFLLPKVICFARSQ